MDPWLLIALIIGVYWSRRAKWERPARGALAFLLLYTVINLGITELGRQAAHERYPGSRVMVAPEPLPPWGRQVVVEQDDVYRFGGWTPGRGLRMSPTSIRKNDELPAVAAARRDPAVRGFVGWARFPFYRVGRDSAGILVRMGDARYTAAAGQGWASAWVRLP